MRSSARRPARGRLCRPAVTLAVILAAWPAAADPDAARALGHYTLHCQGCHLPGGVGVPGRVPPLRGEVGGFLRVPGGREFLVQVPGVAGAQLGDAELAQLLNWMLPALGGDSTPVDFTAYTATEVAALRRSPLRNASEVRTRLRRQIDPAADGY